MNTSHLSLDSELSWSELASLSLLLGSAKSLLVGGQSSADSTSLLEAKIDWLVLENAITMEMISLDKPCGQHRTCGAPAFESG